MISLLRLLVCITTVSRQNGHNACRVQHLFLEAQRSSSPSLHNFDTRQHKFWKFNSLLQTITSFQILQNCSHLSTVCVPLTIFWQASSWAKWVVCVCVCMCAHVQFWTPATSKSSNSYPVKANAITFLQLIAFGCPPAAETYCDKMLPIAPVQALIHTKKNLKQITSQPG